MLATVVVVPIVVVSGVWVRNKAVGPEEWLRDDAEKAIKAKLIDPSSFVMRDSYLVRTPEKNGMVNIALCGIFDARNRMGGYTGGSRFMSYALYGSNSYSLITVETEDAEGKRDADNIGWLSPFEKVYWNEHCVDAAHPPLQAKRHP